MERLYELRDQIFNIREFVKFINKDNISDTCKSLLVEKIGECLNLSNDLLRFSIKETDLDYEVMKDAGEFEFTIDLMRSADYKERFKAEYYQTKIRYGKLHKMLIKAEAGTLDFKLTCPLELLKEQKHHMGMYLHALEVRAEIEDIEL